MRIILILWGVCGLLASPLACASSLLAEPKLAPHEATYRLELEQNRPASQVISASGKLVFMLNDSCDGWTNDQMLEIRLLYTEGEQTNLVVKNSSWEAKDGSIYTFASRTLRNGEQAEIYRGRASLSATGGEAVYSVPAGRTLQLSAGTVFPAQHSLMILRHAQAGEKVPARIVFDGTDEQAESEVSVFLSKPVPLADDKSITDSLRKHPLLQQAAWPTQLAFFSREDEKKPKASDNDDATDDTASGTPDYELRLDLLPNNVARRVLIDYGTFTMRGTLSELKSLPDAGCTTP